LGISPGALRARSTPTPGRQQTALQRAAVAAGFRPNPVSATPKDPQYPYLRQPST